MSVNVTLQSIMNELMTLNSNVNAQVYSKQFVHTYALLKELYNEGKDVTFEVTTTLTDNTKKVDSYAFIKDVLNKDENNNPLFLELNKVTLPTPNLKSVCKGCFLEAFYGIGSLFFKFFTYYNVNVQGYELSVTFPYPTLVRVNLFTEVSRPNPSTAQVHYCLQGNCVWSGEVFNTPYAQNLGLPDSLTTITKFDERVIVVDQVKVSIGTPGTHWLQIELLGKVDVENKKVIVPNVEYVPLSSFSI